jgi:hypothetical protein
MVLSENCSNVETECWFSRSNELNYITRNKIIFTFCKITGANVIYHVMKKNRNQFGLIVVIVSCIQYLKFVLQ